MKEEKFDPDSSEKKASIDMGIRIVLGLILFAWGSYWVLVAPRIGKNKFDLLTLSSPA